jgi:hypothetical protein
VSDFAITALLIFDFGIGYSTGGSALRSNFGKLLLLKGSNPYFFSAESVMPSPSESVKSPRWYFSESFGAVGLW